MIRARLLLAALLAALLGFAAAAIPASAHSGGRAVVLIRTLALVPAASGWQANVVLTDNDSGDPIQGSRVSALVGTPAQEVALKPGSNPGSYQGTLPDAKPGPLALALKVRTAPGTAAVVPFNSETWTVELVAGETNTVVASGGGGGSNLPLIMGVAAAVLAVALLYGLYSVRRRTAAPVRSK